jgi:acyl-coenzyme A thioesterase PaaI-like protein
VVPRLRAMSRYVHEELSAEEISRQERLYGPLAQAVRELVDATIRTRVDDDEIRAVRGEIEAATARLRQSQLEGSFGVPFNADLTTRPWGNSVVGLRNPIAPPLVVERAPDGRAWADFHLGAAYEGPPGLVHGGVSALVLDQILGEAAAAKEAPGMTGTLTVRYRRPTPLGDLHAEARVERVAGYKTFVSGSIGDAEGVTVEAEGVFVLPRWARDLAPRQDRFE